MVALGPVVNNVLAVWKTVFIFEMAFALPADCRHVGKQFKDAFEGVLVFEGLQLTPIQNAFDEDVF